MPRFKHDTHDAGDMSTFAPISGSTELIRIEGDAGAYLQRMAKIFPDELNRALRSLGYHLRQEIHSAMRNDGIPTGTRWRRISLMREFRRMERAKEIGWRNIKNEQSFALKKLSKKRQRLEQEGQAFQKSFFNRWKQPAGGSNRKKVFGGVAQAIRYKHDKKNMRVFVGFITPSASAFAEAVQGGSRGAKGSFHFRGRQPVTDKMRKAFWAAGVPIGKDTRYLEQKERPLIEPIFRMVQPNIQRILEERIRQINNRETGRANKWTLNIQQGRWNRTTP